MSSTTPLMSLRVQRKRYAGRGPDVLSELRVEVAHGEIVALLGARGSGKSTLLRIVAGHDTNFTGQLVIEGLRQYGPSDAVGIVFEAPRLFPWLSVARNVGFVAGQRYDARRVAALLARVGLAGFADLPPHRLTASQAQRVAVARALYTEPRLLLLDAPFAASDPATRARLEALVLELVAERGCGLLTVAQDADEAARVAGRVLQLPPGPGSVLREPGANHAIVVGSQRL